MIKISMRIKINPDGKASLGFPQIKGMDLSKKVEDLSTDQTRALMLLTAITRLTESFNRTEPSFKEILNEMQAEAKKEDAVGRFETPNGTAIQVGDEQVTVGEHDATDEQPTP